MRYSENFDQVISAIGVIQQLVPFVDKSKSVEIARAVGSSKEQYAPFEEVVEAIHPYCVALGLVWTQDGREGHAGSQWLDTTIWHPASRQWKVSTLQIATPKPGFREVGAAMSYFRRTALLAAFGIVAKGEDPDEKAARQMAEAKPPRMDPNARPAMNATDADRIIGDALENLKTATTLQQIAEISKTLSNGSGGTIVPAKRAKEIKEAFEERRAQLRMGEKKQ